MDTPKEIKPWMLERFDTSDMKGRVMNKPWILVIIDNIEDVIRSARLYWLSKQLKKLRGQLDEFADLRRRGEYAFSEPCVNLADYGTKQCKDKIEKITRKIDRIRSAQ